MITDELIRLKKKNVLEVEQRLLQKKPICNNLNNSFSGILIIGDIKTFVWKWLPDDFIEKYDIDLKKDQTLSSLEFIEKYVHPSCLPIAAFKIVRSKILASDKPFEILECARTNRKLPYKWYHKTMKFSKINNCTISIVHKIEKKSINTNLSDEEFIVNNLDKYEKLTKRQREVLKLLALGKTNKEIAFDLNISVNTVRTFRNQIHKILDLRWKNINHSQTYLRYAKNFELIIS